MSTAEVIGYGKLPVHGDFVRHNANGTSVRALDEWLQEGLYLAKTRLGRQFEAAYDATPSFRFLVARSEAEPAIVGALRPSRDRSRRTFPFLIAAEADLSPGDPRLTVRLPVSFAAFLDQADRLSTEVVRGHVGHRDVGDWLEQSGLAAAAVDPNPIYERYLNETTLASWCEQHWGYFDDSRKYLLFRNLLELLEPLDRDIPPGFTLGLKFPLGTHRSPELHVTFWMDLCLHMLGLPVATPVCFWTVSASSATRDFLVLFFRLPPPRAMSELLPIESTGDYVCDLESLNDASAAEAVLALPSRIGALLESEEISLQEFLNGLAIR